MEYNTYYKGGLLITEDSQFSNDKYGITPELSTILQDLFFEINVNKVKSFTTKKIIKLIEQYPKCPQLKNYLAVAYQSRGERDKLNEINQQILIDHPDYLFGLFGLVTKQINENKFDEALTTLGSTLLLKDLYPDRDLFHLAEVLGYFKLVIMYYAGLGKLAEAEEVLQQMKEINKEHIDVEEAEGLLYDLRMKTSLNYLTNLNSKKKKRGINILENIPQITKPPKFNHTEINYLYANDITIEQELIHEILALPKQTLIEDLESLLKDAEFRFGHFYSLKDNKFLDFPLHAIFLLMELKSESSLPKILNFLKGDEEFLDFWLGDHITETLWQCLYKLAFNNTKALAAVLIDDNYYTFIKSTVSEALCQMALHNQHKQDEISDIYCATLNYYNASNFDEELIDKNYLGMLIGDVIDTNQKQLLPIIKELYEKDFVDTMVNGDFNYLKKAFDNLNVNYHKMDINNIFEIYENTTYNLGSNYYENEFQDWGSLEPIKADPKIGRNEPCPCGSGKKYKKCCI
ncbi:DUF1186 domain-containing protein [Pedobacter alpinus]|uniref:DUF1186 domain-containing protein n=1 Tax=Pedobacter alpinus TaxID=1590643 RepID=A0ABW5TWE0_9SPHI